MDEPVTAEEEEWLAQMDNDFVEEPEDHLDLEEDSLPPPRRPPCQLPRAALPRLSRSPARLAMPPPPTVPDEVEPLPPLPETPKGDYELFRDQNVAELEREFLRIFGEPLNRREPVLNKFFG
jgi:hypothetical protein